MEKELLNESTVVAYLTGRGIISGPAEVEELTGGVSNVVLAVKSESKDLVLKQALPQLKVAAVWKADQRRAIVEANGMKLLHSITPENVPELIDFDPEDFTLTMERRPPGTLLLHFWGTARRRQGGGGVWPVMKAPRVVRTSRK